MIKRSKLNGVTATYLRLLKEIGELKRRQRNLDIAGAIKIEAKKIMKIAKFRPSADYFISYNIWPVRVGELDAVVTFDRISGRPLIKLNKIAIRGKSQVRFSVYQNYD